MSVATPSLPRSVSSHSSYRQFSRKSELLERAASRMRTEQEGSFVYMNRSHCQSPLEKSPVMRKETKSDKRLRRNAEAIGIEGYHSHRYILKTLKKAYQIEKEATPKPLKFEAFQSRFEGNRRKKDEVIPEEPVAGENEDRRFSRYVPFREIELRCTEDMNRSWLRRHGTHIENRVSKVQGWVKSLHSLLDPSGLGYVPGPLLIGQLLALGLAHDPEDIVHIMLAIYGKTEAEELALTLGDMLELTKVDRETNKFLNFLSERIATRGGDSLSPLRSDRFCGSWRDLLPTLPEYISEVARLWQEISFPTPKLAESKRVAEALCSFQLYPTLVDARKALGKERDKITQSEFTSLFSKSIFVGSLIALALKLIPMNVTVSAKMMISKYQRRLLLAGLQGSKNGVDHQSGLATVKAVEKYEAVTLPKGDYTKLYTYGLSAK